MDDPLASQWRLVQAWVYQASLYGVAIRGRQYSFSDFVMDHIVEQRKVICTRLVTMLRFTFLAKVIWDSIGEIVHAATDAMAWSFKKPHGLPVRKACLSADTPVNFRASGIQGHQALPGRHQLLGSVIQPTLYKETGKIDKTVSRHQPQLCPQH